MNRRVVVLGVVVALVGVGLWYAPIEPLTSGPSPLHQIDDIIELSAPFDVLGSSVGYVLTWSAPSDTSVFVYDCGFRANCTYVQRSDYVTGGTGRGGTLRWSGRPGQYFVFDVTSLPVSVKLQYWEPVLGGFGGIGTLVFGGVLSALGYVFGVPSPPRRSRARGPDGARAGAAPGSAPPAQLATDQAAQDAPDDDAHR